MWLRRRVVAPRCGCAVGHPQEQPRCDRRHDSAPGGRSLSGIDVHRTRRLLPQDATNVEGIPCTTVARTLLDLAEVVNRRQVERACDQADVERLLDATALEAVLSRAHGRRGSPVLRAILDEHAIGQTVTRSEMEERFLAICNRAGLPRPEVNVWIALPHGGHAQADFLWREHRLIVETDGRAAHGTRRAFEHDRRRDQRLVLAGWRVIRVTWRQLTQEAERARPHPSGPGRGSRPPLARRT